MDLHTLSCCSAPVIRRGPDKELSEGATPSYPTHQPSTSPPPPHLSSSLSACVSQAVSGAGGCRAAGCDAVGDVPESSVTRRRRRRRRRKRREGDWTGAALFLGGYRSELSRLGCGRWWQRPGDLTEAADWGRCPGWSDGGGAAATTSGLGLAGCSSADRTGITDLWGSR